VDGEHLVREGLYYTREHEWAKVEGALVRVGVTDYAQKKLGDVVYVELPDVGKRIRQVAEPKTSDMEIGTLESIKAVSVVYSPLSGVIKEVNSSLADKPELVNSSPYDDGWICVLEPSSLEAELEKLMDSKNYIEYIKKIK